MSIDNVNFAVSLVLYLVMLSTLVGSCALYASYKLKETRQRRVAVMKQSAPEPMLVMAPEPRQIQEPVTPVAKRRVRFG